MRIIGNTVGTTIPKPDWLQEDPKKGDYIKNKEAASEVLVAKYEVTPIADIITAENSGKAVFCNKGNSGITLPLVMLDRDVATFAGMTHDTLHVMVNYRGTWSWTTDVMAKESDTILVVTRDTSADGLVFDKTYEEIYAAHEAGRTILLRSVSQIYFCAGLVGSGSDIFFIFRPFVVAYANAATQEYKWLKLTDGNVWSENDTGFELLNETKVNKLIDAKNKIFIAEYGVTTIDELTEAVGTYDNIFCKNGAIILPMVSSAIPYTFAGAVADENNVNRLVSYSTFDDEWSTFERNIVDEVTNGSADIPTGGGVYEAIQGAKDTLVVTVNTTYNGPVTTYSTDVDYAAIKNAVDNGKDVIVRYYKSFGSGPSAKYGYQYYMYYYVPSPGWLSFISLATLDGTYELLTLTSDGTVTFATYDIPVVKTTAQELTDDQKAQVKENIGIIDGLSDTAANLLITILHNGTYTEDQSENIAALAIELLGGVAQIGDTLYIVNNVNVTQNEDVLVIE